MKFAKALLGCSLLFALLLVGCVHSANPFYRDQDVVFDPALIGSWCDSRDADETDTNRVTWTFSAGERKAYDLKLSGTDGGKEVALSFQVRLFELEGNRFLDVYPTREEVSAANEKYGWLGFFRPTHSVVRLPKDDKQLVMEILLPKKVGEYLKRNKTGFEEYEERIVLTGSTRQAQRMLRESLRQAEWWDDVAKLVRCGK